MSSFHRLIKPSSSSSSFGGGRNAFHGILKQYHTKGYDETKPLSIICPWVTKDPVCEESTKSPPTTTYKLLGPGMILLKHYISLKDQVDLVNTCEKWGLGPGGFYIPTYQDGEKLRLRMMCFGRNWDPVTRYEKHVRSDGSVPPPLPSQLTSLAETTIQDAQAHLDSLPSMRPDICLVNFYSPIYGRLGLHQDIDESSDSLQRGLPVVSISIGDSAEFLYGHTSDEDKLNSVYLQSGDVLIFGGKSRLIYHALNQVFPGTSPLPLKQQTALRPGRLNLTFRQL